MFEVEEMRWMTLLLSLCLLISGCTQTVMTTQPIDENLQESPDETDQNIVESPEIIPATNRSEIEQTQELMASVIADGTYEDEITYSYHSGEERIIVKVTTKDDVVTDASVTGINPHKTSAKFISAFNDALPELVIGKKINEIEIEVLHWRAPLKQV
jgi:hypothetical protein